jgi:Tol biopolymer transport system component
MDPRGAAVKKKVEWTAQPAFPSIPHRSPSQGELSMALFLVLSILALSEPSGPAAGRFDLSHPGKIVRLSDPQISPDGMSVALVVSRANWEDNRFDPQLVLLTIASRAQRPLTQARRGVSSPRWSPQGDRLAFLAQVEGKAQIFVMPLAGGDALQLTKLSPGVQQFAWSPDGTRIAFVASDEPPQRTDEERHNKAFEAAHNDFLTLSQPLPAHLWIVPSAGGTPERLTSGSWSLPIAFPPSSPASPPSWSPDGKSIAIVRVATAYSGDRTESAVQVLDLETGALRPLTGGSRYESQPQISPDGLHLAYWYPRDGQTRNVNEIHLVPAAGGPGTSLTRGLDRSSCCAVDSRARGRSLRRPR